MPSIRCCCGKWHIFGVMCPEGRRIFSERLAERGWVDRLGNYHARLPKWRGF